MPGLLAKLGLKPTPKASQDGRSAATLDIEAEFNQAQSMVGHGLAVIEASGAPVSGARLLEIGPGNNLAHAFHLMDLGVEVTLADRFPSQWDDAFHGPLYRGILERWGKPFPGLERALNGGGHKALKIVAEPAEALRSLKDASFDAVFSIAVLEHVFDLDKVGRELFRVTRPGGAHGHQIDFRDHRDFSRPLEFLLIEDVEWKANLKNACWSYGNRLRASETEAAFRGAGFDIELNSPNANPTPEYLADLAPRLAFSNPRFCGLSKADLETLGAYYRLRRPLP